MWWRTGKGDLTKGVTPNIVVNCSNLPHRHQRPPARAVRPSRCSCRPEPNQSYFGNLSEAKVRVTTEEEIREVDGDPGSNDQRDLRWRAHQLHRFQQPGSRTVNASTFEGNRLNKCVVTNATNVSTTNVVTRRYG